MKKQLLITTGLSIILATSTALAENMRTFAIEGFQDISLGHFKDMALTEEGVLRLGLPSRGLVDLPGYNFVDGAIWNNQIYLADTENAKVVVLGKDGQLAGDISFEGELITALSVIRNQLYVLTSSPAAIYKIGPKGDKKKLANLSDKYKYLWQMVAGPKDKMYLATGEPAAVVQVDGKWQTEELFQPEQSHLTAINMSPDGTITTGGSKNGLIYSGKPGESFKALYKTQYADIQSIIFHKNHLYVVATKGGDKIMDDEVSKDDITGAIYRIDKRGQVERLVTATGELMLDIVVDPKGNILVSTASLMNEQRGQIYSIDVENSSIAIMHEANSQRLVKMLSMDEQNWLLVEGSASKLELLGKSLANEGEYITEVINTKGLSTLGRLSVHAYVPDGQEMTFSMRGGLTNDPSQGWQEWSQPIAFPGGQVNLEAGRYYQIKVNMKGDGQSSPELYKTWFTYLRDNDPPVVHAVKVVADKEMAFNGIKRKLPDEHETIKITNGNLADLVKGAVKEDGEEEDDGDSLKAYVIPKKGVNTVVWMISDPTGDQLESQLYYREVRQKEWTKLVGPTKDQYFSLQPNVLPDGRYFFKVEVTDIQSNGPERALSASGQSQVVVIDHGLPVISELKKVSEKKEDFLLFKAKDAVSILSNVAVTINGQQVMWLRPVDGLLDGPEEDFKIALPKSKVPLKVIIEVEDSAGNRIHHEETVK